MRAFVFPGQGGGVVEPATELLPQIRRVVGERIPDQVKMFARAAGCFDFETGLWLVAERDRFLAEAAEETPGGMVAILKADPRDIEEALEESEGSVIANYNTPRQTVISGLRGALGDAVSKIRGRKIPLNVSFAAHSPYVAAAGE